jgi:hypothetical protein
VALQAAVGLEDALLLGRVHWLAGKNRSLDRERRKSQYGFPNGDCNCTTVGLPLLAGRMDEFIDLPGIISYPTRRFGKCV